MSLAKNGQGKTNRQLREPGTSEVPEDPEIDLYQPQVQKFVKPKNQGIEEVCKLIQDREQSQDAAQKHQANEKKQQKKQGQTQGNFKPNLEQLKQELELRMLAMEEERQKSAENKENEG